MRDLKEFDADPEPSDENDPESQQEIFRVFRLRGYSPEDIEDKRYAKQYARWLKSAPPAD